MYINRDQSELKMAEDEQVIKNKAVTLTMEGLECGTRLTIKFLQNLEGHKRKM